MGLAFGVFAIAELARPLPGWTRWLGLAAGVLYAVSQFAVRPALRRLRASMGGSTDGVAEADPRRRRFGMLHGVSMLLFAVQLPLVAIALVGVALGR